ncbi:hypothetical protein RJ639_033286 [Escallonia herrerae]|uniref:RIN4 pathogenic type III effector avirulence factor Avr cleavage site domain-containing protein n=1 Tax=Escallonia herrerae TaxID=1293975 RepID=A0AA88WU07_9ASTE|nr:hypothetical protein RJ639_033286 [Escallonia herrerae]
MWSASVLVSSIRSPLIVCKVPKEKGRPLPKFGEWDVNDPASAEGFTVIFNKARNEKKTGGKPDSPPKDDSVFKHGATLGKPQSVSCSHCCITWLPALLGLLLQLLGNALRICMLSFDLILRKSGVAACSLLLQNLESVPCKA